VYDGSAKRPGGWGFERARGEGDKGSHALPIPSCRPGGSRSEGSRGGGFFAGRGAGFGWVTHSHTRK
jgi:hypothetical protein